MGLIAFVTLCSARSGAQSVPADSKHAALVVCLPAYIDSFDPTNHRSRLTQLVLKNIFESLTTRDQQSQIVPQLAESWQSLDLLTWEFKLRKGVKFHNGDEFGAQDVKFTLDRVIQPPTPDGQVSPRRELFRPVRDVEVVDNHTVRIVTWHPWAILPTMLSLQEIVPQKYIESDGLQKFLRRPVGTGPFQFVSAQKDREIVLNRFKDYHDLIPHLRTEHEIPVDYLVFKVIPQKIDQIAALKRGEVDLVFNVPPSAVEVLRKTPNLQVLSHRATRSYFAEINCVKPPFHDRRIRQALNYAVDKSVLVNHILAGHGQVLPTVLQPDAFGYNADLIPYPYDPQKARELFKAGGYPTDRPISVHCNNEDREVANILALFLTRVGFSAKVRVAASYRPTEMGRKAEWDIFVGSWGNTTLDPVDILLPKFKSDGRGNYSGYENAKVDRLFEEAERCEDMVGRAGAYREIQKIVHEDAPMIFGYAPHEFYGLQKRVRNFVPSPTGMFQFGNVYLESGS